MNQVMIYNTLAKKKMPFEPLEPGKVKMYVCGPTTYNYIHLATHARSSSSTRCAVISAISLRRHLCFQLTDVDDKIINRANEEGKDPVALAATTSTPSLKTRRR